MIKHSRRLVVSMAVLGIALSGCQSTKGARVFFKGKPASSASVLTALDGGLVARSGVKLEANDKQRALEAEYRALEVGAVGQDIAWKGSDASGSVVAAAPFQVGSQNCRQYTHKLTADGKDAESRGVACRNEDGTWSLLN